jgi:hypothetical protein
MMDWLKRLARLLFGDYAIYQIWQLDRSPQRSLPAAMSVRRLVSDDLAAPGVYSILGEAGWYFGDEADGLAASRTGSLRRLPSTGTAVAMRKGTAGRSRLAPPSWFTSPRPRRCAAVAWRRRLSVRQRRK